MFKGVFELATRAGLTIALDVTAPRGILFQLDCNFTSKKRRKTQSTIVWIVLSL